MSKDERAKAELKIADKFPGLPADKLIKKVITKVTDQLLRIEGRGMPS